LEFFSGEGETVSVGAFYKDIQKPMELTRELDVNYTLYRNANSSSATSYGLEFELRKKLGFINSDKADFWNLFAISANAAFLRSTVVGRRVSNGSAEEGPLLIPATGPDPAITYLTQNFINQKTNRPLFGQTPVLYNVGLEYNGKKVGLSVVHNYTGPKFFILSSNMWQNEYESEYAQTDAQCSLNVLKDKAKLKLNLTNIFGSRSFFYNGFASYTEFGDQRIPGFTDNYEKGDEITFKKYNGRTFSISFNYKFK
jgi:hypothetical protein